MSQNIAPPQTHKGSPDAETRQGVILNIESGLLADSERFIDKPGFVIGSGKEADILLLDEGIAPTHLVISITRSMLGVSISVHALAEGVLLDDNPLEIEETSHSQQELEISVMGVRLKIQDAKGYVYKSDATEENTTDNTTEPHQQENRLPVFLAISAILCFGISTFLFMYSFDTPSLESNNNTDIEVPYDEHRDRFILQLKQKMKEAELDTLLEVRKKSSNGIEVTGNLRNNHDKKWLAVLQWYDAQQNPPLLFNQVNKVTNNHNLPLIKFAWFGKEPYIVLQNNQKVLVGQTINSGWKVDTVDAKGITLSQAENRILLKFE